MAHLHFFVRLLVSGITISILMSLCEAEEPPFELYTVERHEIESKIVGQTFTISVQLPIRLKDGSERFPVLYVTDAITDSRFERENFYMQWLGDIPRFIAVSVGYPTWAEWQLRDRDFTPTDTGPVEAYGGFIDFGSIPFEGVRTGGAANFLKFLREELKPFIDKNYPTIPQDSGYFGDSLGGLFGLYVLLNEPTTFNRYILGSPSTWWDNEVIMKQAEAFGASGRTINARLLMSAGALEEDEHHMVSNIPRLETSLSNVKGLQIETYVFPDESHMTVESMNYIRGVQWTYKTAEPWFYDAYKTKKETDKGPN
ncbi:MAG: alpha/beta hydrolase [Proteobacteria bacterium]|nr:alpha/beta hydrolase [Pseudomonadota bacterium]